MHCPHCGVEAAPDRKFCRACGFHLTEISRVYDEEREVGTDGAGGKKRATQNTNSRIGIGLIVGSLAIIFISAYWVVIKDIIIGKGQVIGGSLFLLVLTAVVTGGLLMFWPSEAERQPSRQGLSEDESTPLFPESRTAIAPSVTERTTNLIESGSVIDSDLQRQQAPRRERQ
jgi:hypothetical protein